MELFPRQLPYPYVYLSLIYLLYYYVVAYVVRGLLVLEIKN
jgi:hypothetical protein